MPPHAAATLKNLYDALTALDQVAAALLTSNGSLIAAADFSAQTSQTERQLARVVICVALLSAGLSLWVVRVFYPFLDNVIKTPGGLDFTKEFEILDGEVKWQTTLYRIVWTLSLTIVASLLFYFFWTLIRRSCKLVVTPNAGPTRSSSPPVDQSPIPKFD